MLDRRETPPPQSRARRRRSRLSSVGLGLSLFAIQMIFVSGRAVAHVQPEPSFGATDPSLAVNPSWENAPWEPKVQTILNVTAQAALACCVLAFLVGGAAMGVGRIIGSYQAGTRGLQFVLGGAGGALVIASASSVVSWLIS